MIGEETCHSFFFALSESVDFFFCSPKTMTSTSSRTKGSRSKQDLNMDVYDRILKQTKEAASYAKNQGPAIIQEAELGLVDSLKHWWRRLTVLDEFSAHKMKHSLPRFARVFFDKSPFGKEVRKRELICR